MKKMLLVSSFVLAVACLPLLAEAPPAEQCPAIAEAPALPGLELAPEPVPLVVSGYFACFSDCLNPWIDDQCQGLTGSAYQQCVNAGAEGCRCACGGYCP